MKKIKITPTTKPYQLKSYWLKEWKVVLIATISGCLFNGGLPLIAIYQGYLIDEFVRNVGFTQLLSAFSQLLLVVLLLQIARIIKRYAVRLFANKTIATMRLMIFNKMLHLDITESFEDSTGDWMNKTITDVELCVEGMRKGTTEVFDTGVLIISYVLAMMVQDMKLTLVVIIFIPITLFLAQGLKNKIVLYTRASRDLSTQLTSLTYESIDHALLFKLHGLSKNLRIPYLKTLNEHATCSFKADLMQNALYPLYNALSLIGIVGVFVMGGQKVIDGVWSLGSFTAYLLIFNALSVKASKAAKLFNSFQMASVSWERIKPHFSEFEEFNSNKTLTHESVSLQLKNVDFSYNTPLIKDLSLQITSGCFIGICGPIASGKTTLGLGLLNLVPYTGQILLNNKELSTYSSTELISFIAYCGHQPQLFNDTIRNNITFGEDKSIDSVLQDVCLDEEIKARCDGVNTLIGSGGCTLSGGQQSRIALARALYTNCPILILDDPCSSLDLATEYKIIQNLKRHYSNRIILYISHRLQYFNEMDSVLILHQDGTSTFAPHELLIKENKDYQELLKTGGIDHE